MSPRRRPGWLLLLAGMALVAAACDQKPQAGPGSCTRITAPSPTADGPPVGVLRDVGGGPVDYLVGAPGGVVAQVPEASGQIPPVKVGDRLWFTVAGSTEGTLEVRTARLGECSAHVTDGTIGPADPGGKAIVVGSAATWRMYDTAGKSLADLEGIRGTWTPDGYLVEPRTAGGVAVYDEAGRRKDLDLPSGAAANGPFGPGYELLSTEAGLLSLDVRTGATSPLPHSPDHPTNLEASADGKYLSYFDANRNPQVMRVADGVTAPLAAPGPATGLTWSRDGQWVAVQTPYGGAVVRVRDMKSIDTGPLIVISW